MAARKTTDWRPAFLEAFIEEATVTAACKTAGVSRVAAYVERKNNPSFAAHWAEAEEAVTERLEREAFRRAAEGVERAIYHQGQVVGREKQFSDTLLIFLLKARRPATYRENVFVDHSPVHVHHEVTLLDGRQPVEVEGPNRRAAARALLEAVPVDG